MIYYCIKIIYSIGAYQAEGAGLVDASEADMKLKWLAGTSAVHFKKHYTLEFHMGLLPSSPPARPSRNLQEPKPTQTC